MADEQQSRAIARRKRVAFTKSDVATAKYREQIRHLERQGKIAAWNDYIGFWVSKILGMTGLIVGGIETLAPQALPIALKNPALIAGIGLALLTGKSILTLIAKAETSIGGQK